MIPKPKSIGKYRISRELGRGAMGIVYEGIDVEIERRVALKTINFDAETNDCFIHCLKQEARAVARLDHPNIVTLFEAFELGDTYCLVLQYVEGHTLLHYTQGPERPPACRAVSIVLQLLDALDYAHGRGVVHRDVKPSNIVLTSEGRIKLMDFGISRPVGTGLTSSGIVMGTPGYMSPEQFLGESVDGRSDIFSAGCVLFELLSGKRPFASQDVNGEIYRMLHERPGRLPVSLDWRFNGILAKALAKRPQDRYKDCVSFAADLRCVMPYDAQEALKQRLKLPRASVSVSSSLLLMALLLVTTRSSEGRRIAHAAPPSRSQSHLAVPPVTVLPLSGSESSSSVRAGSPAAPARQTSSVSRTHTLQYVGRFDSLIIAGDEAFQQGRYSQALARYKDAARIQSSSLVGTKLKQTMMMLGEDKNHFNEAH